MTRSTYSGPNSGGYVISTETVDITAASGTDVMLYHLTAPQGMRLHRVAIRWLSATGTLSTLKFRKSASAAPMITAAGGVQVAANDTTGVATDTVTTLAPTGGTLGFSGSAARDYVQGEQFAIFGTIATAAGRLVITVTAAMKDSHPSTEAND